MSKANDICIYFVYTHIWYKIYAYEMGLTCMDLIRIQGDYIKCECVYKVYAKKCINNTFQ
jgi:hypothetical protein